jgi:hypothetical protein
MNKNRITLLLIAACATGPLLAGPLELNQEQETSSTKKPDVIAMREAFLHVLKETLPYAIENQGGATVQLTLKVAGNQSEGHLSSASDKFGAKDSYYLVRAEDFGLPSDFASMITVELNKEDVEKYRENSENKTLVMIKLLNSFVHKGSEEIFSKGTRGAGDELQYAGFQDILEDLLKFSRTTCLVSLLLAAKKLSL